jgi:hypothetical protein
VTSDEWRCFGPWWEICIPAPFIWWWAAYRLVKESETFFFFTLDLPVYRSVNAVVVYVFDVVEEKVNVVVKKQVYCTILNSCHSPASPLVHVPA